MFDQPQTAREFDVTGWVFRISMGLLFIGLGLAKFNSDGYWVKLFQEIGYGDWFRYLTAGLQVLGGLLFLVRRTVRVGAFLTGGTMAGAIVVHMALLDTGVGGAVFPAVLLAVIVLVALRPIA